MERKEDKPPVTGYIDSVYCGSGVDGKGLRCVVFFSGCNLRCPFCHNPETLYKRGREVTAEALFAKLLRYKPYFRKGGVTLSGGEPFLQKDFLLALVRMLKEEGIHVVAETNGQIADDDIVRALDGVIVDVKNQESDDLTVYREFLNRCDEVSCPYTVTNVLVPGKNDTEQKLMPIAALMKGRKTHVKFLPFRKLCEEKYRELGIPFAYGHLREGEQEDLEKAEYFLRNV